MYAEFLRQDLEPKHREYVEDALVEIARNCVNAGFGENLARIKAELIMEQKLLDLKIAYEQSRTFPT